jgi:hypothetical protein
MTGESPRQESSHDASLRLAAAVFASVDDLPLVAVRAFARYLRRVGHPFASAFGSYALTAIKERPNRLAQIKLALALRMALPPSPEGIERLATMAPPWPAVAAAWRELHPEIYGSTPGGRASPSTDAASGVRRGAPKPLGELHDDVPG